MAQNDDYPIRFGKLAEGALDCLRPLPFHQPAIGGRLVRHDLGVADAARIVLQGPFGASFALAQFIITKVQRDPPEEGRKAAGRLVILPPGKDAGEGFLGQVLRPMRVAGHPVTEAPDGFLPAPDQFGEGLRVVLHLHPPHRLFVRHRPKDRQRGEERIGHRDFHGCSIGLGACSLQLSRRLNARRSCLVRVNFEKIISEGPRAARSPAPTRTARFNRLDLVGAWLGSNSVFGFSRLNLA